MKRFELGNLRSSAIVGVPEEAPTTHSDAFSGHNFTFLKLLFIN